MCVCVCARMVCHRLLILKDQFGAYMLAKAQTVTIFTLPALPKHLCGLFLSNFPGNLALKNGGDFWWISFWSPVPTKQTKNLLMPLFLMGCFPLDFREAKRPLRTKSGKCPIKVGKRCTKEGKRPIKVMVLVGISVGCLMGCFRATLPWRKTAPLKRPIKRSMNKAQKLLKISGKNRTNIRGQNSGRKFENSGNFHSATFLT